jgi:two-component system response regulator RegA
MNFLIIDDDERFRERLARAIRERGFNVHAAASGEEGLTILRDTQIDRILIDLKMPGGSGITFITKILALHPTSRIVILTGYGSIATAVEALKLGAFNYLTKPLNADRILAAFNDKPDLEIEKNAVPSLDAVEWEHIQRVLSDCDGNVSRASKLLGMHRRSLQRKLDKYAMFEKQRVL